MSNNKYIQECTNCGNVVVGREKRGFIRDALHGGPGTAVEFIPVGGKLIWKASKEIVLGLLRTDMEKWGDELEKWIYKDIQVAYELLCDMDLSKKRKRDIISISFASGSIQDCFSKTKRADLRLQSILSSRKQ